MTDIAGYDFHYTNNDNVYPMLSGSSNSTLVITYGKALLRPIWLDGQVCDGLRFQVSAAVVSSTCRIALYAPVSATDQLPGTIIQQSGDIATGTTGVKEYAFTQDTFNAGLYWIGVLQTSNTAGVTLNSKAVSTADCDAYTNMLSPRTDITTAVAGMTCIYNTNYAGSPLTSFPTTWNEAISFESSDVAMAMIIVI